MVQAVVPFRSLKSKDEERFDIVSVSLLPGGWKGQHHYRIIWHCKK